MGHLPRELPQLRPKGRQRESVTLHRGHLRGGLHPVRMPLGFSRNICVNTHKAVRKHLFEKPLGAHR